MVDASAQSVASAMGTQPDVATLAKASAADIYKREFADPKVQSALKEQSASVDKAQAEIDEGVKALKGVDDAAKAELHQWNTDQMQQKYTTPAMEQFGSAGSVFALLASAFSHQPLIAGLQGAAAAMTAIQKGDAEAYSRAYDAWKQNTDLALKRYDLERNEVKDILDLVMKEPQLAAAKLQAATAQYGMAIESHSTVFGDWVKTQQLAVAKEEAAARIKEADAKTVPYDILRQNIAEYKEAHHGAAPDSKTLSSMWQMAQLGDLAANPDTRQATAAQVASGQPISQVIPGFGKAAADQRRLAHDDAIRLIMEQGGMDAVDAGAELARRTIEFQSGKASVQQLTIMEGATKQAVAQLNYNVDKVTSILKTIPSSDISPVINAIARGEEQWSGDPRFSSLFYSMSAAAVESARILSGGQASRAQLHANAMEEAKQWANINMTPWSWMAPDGVAATMKAEGEVRLTTYRDAKTSMLKGDSAGGGKQYSVGDIVTGRDGKKYRVTGGDPSNPDVELVQ